jgi:hypothetical protein
VKTAAIDHLSLTRRDVNLRKEQKRILVRSRLRRGTAGWIGEKQELLKRSLYLSALLIAVLHGQSLDRPVLPTGATVLEVAPGGQLKLKFHFVAVGKQIYQCENGQWASNSTPDATLYDMNSNLKIRHGSGPSWTTIDGKSTMKAIGSSAIHFPAPDRVSIDWLKLDVDRSSRTGEFSDVAVVQRLYTGGGKAPTTGCAAHETYDAPYTAHYYFWASM